MVTMTNEDLVGLGVFILATIGSFNILWIWYRLLGGIYRTFIRPSINLKKRYGAQDGWVVITGATGI